MITRYTDFVNEMFDGKALTFYTFDCDDNLLYFQTVIHMDHLVGGQWVPEDVSTEKFAEVRSEKDWRTNTEAFVEFRDWGPRGKDTFLSDFKAAVMGKKFGPSWSSFIECLVNGYIFSIITSRGHAPDNVRRAFEWLIYEHGLDSFRGLPLKGVDRDRSLTDQMVDNLLSYHELYGSKPEGVVDEYLDHCPIYTVTSKEFSSQFGEMTVEEAKKAALHDFTGKVSAWARKIGARAKVGFSDDDPRFVKAAIDTFLDMTPVHGDIDFTVFDTGKGGMRRIDVD